MESVVPSHEHTSFQMYRLYLSEIKYSISGSDRFFFLG